MKIRILTIGRIRKPWVADGVREFLDRLNPRPGVSVEPVIPRRGAPESQALLAATSRREHRVAMDRRGSPMSSEALADTLGHLDVDAVPRAAVLIGGADGHADSLLAEMDAVWSFGPATFAHELALLVLVEQIYRAHTILANTPYHRA